ncbi:MAG: hypothetical protein WDA21_02835 [Bacilli bacterium]
MKRKAKKFFTTILAAIMLGTIVYLIFFRNMEVKKEIEPPKVVKKIDDFGYELRENEIKLYSDLFDVLIEELNKEEVNEEEYAKLVAKLFVVGFYNLDNKTSKNDVGGVQFVHPDIVDNFKENAKDTLYKYVESNIYGDRKQELPIVDNIEVSNLKTRAFKYNDITDKKAYEISLEWSYKKDLGYETECELIIVHEDKKLVVVEMD